MHLISTELSTDRQRASTAAVDDAPLRPYLGAVVPKRHARRAVTRNLLKRQIRTAFERHLAALLPGLWVVRLRAPFDRARFVSAASDPLRREVGKELDALFGRASRRQP
jgi:ribonuclease P protein component